MFRTTSDILKGLGVVRPTLLVDEGRARANLSRMQARALRSGVGFRPHFKTHQSPGIARWFAAAGVDRITVSSVPMAEQFADVGWRDITLAFLLNPGELPAIAWLARHLEGKGGRLGVTVDSVEAARALAAVGGLPAAAWLKIDTGYGRTGVPWNDAGGLRAVAAALPAGPVGLLTHAGHSYRARSAADLQALWAGTRERLEAARGSLQDPRLLLSVGDTPTCSIVEDLRGVDEIRPGNFIYYDLMQLAIGSCGPGDLAAAAACPVVGRYPGRREIVIHGGAVHLSKESLPGRGGGTVFGRLGTLTPDGRLGEIIDGAVIVALSQEHGIVRFGPEIAFPDAAELGIGDPVLVWPVHSCLTADLLRHTLILPRGD
ncbi:alanine racemase [bacterium]|nr:alanine racemase [bacterium]